MNSIVTGLDRFRKEYWKKLKGYRIGLLANQASVDGTFNPAKEVISQCLPGHLKALFGPQHGYGGEDQDNMVETAHFYDERAGVPIFSLYSEVRRPLPEMLDLIDVLIVDLQDVGTRVYTFPSTVLNCLKAASRNGKAVLVLDRPNPLGGQAVEGNLLRSDLYSFVGSYRLPMRHGLTLGEMAQIFHREHKMGCDLEVLPMLGWRRHMLWQETGLRWIMPSPNMPLPETAYVYPGQVIWEGTNISEGRGTCRPFEIFGAPFFNQAAIKQAVEEEGLPAVELQEVCFRPTFQKWMGELCKGFMIHILDPHRYEPYRTSMTLLKAVIEVHKREFRWAQPPYEYEFERKPIDLILGDSAIRNQLESGCSISQIMKDCTAELEEYLNWRGPYLMYSQ